MSNLFNIIRKEQRQSFQGIWEVVDEKEERDMGYPGALRNITAHWNAPLEFAVDRYSRDPSSKVWFKPPQDDITETKGLVATHIFRES